MSAFLLDCAIRATLIVFGTAAVLRVLGIRRAAARHAAWAGVVSVMLVLPLWSAAGPRVSVRVLQPASVPTAASRLVPDPPSPKPPARTREIEAPSTPPAGPPAVGAIRRQLLGGVYLLGVFLMLTRLVVGTVYAHRVRRTARIEDGRATTDRCAAPITVGWLAPTPILPAGWQRWPGAKLHAVLVHEGEHARRRDPLVQWLALLNRAVFWFHPLAWWLERRLATLAEEACDTAVLAAGHSPEDYSGYLLDFARSITDERRRIRVAAMAMPGNGLGERIRQILDAAPLPPMSRARIACTVSLCVTSTGLFAGVSLAPRFQAPAAGAAAFEVATVKRCEPTGAERTRRGGRRIDMSSNRLYLECFTIDTLVNVAYVRNEFVLNDDEAARQVRGGPDWIRSDRYTIEAKATGGPAGNVMLGPMLRALLEDWFQLRTHGGADEIPMYGLTVAKGGLKIKPIADGDCVPEDDQKEQSFRPGTISVEGPGGLKPACGAVRGQRRGQVRIWDLGGASIKALADVLDTDRKVLDQTGITDRFNIHLEYTLEEAIPGASRDAADAPVDRTGAAAASLFKAVEEQLGLKLVSIKGPQAYVVIDHIERPSNK